jgi:hypothetical protein
VFHLATTAWHDPGFLQNMILGSQDLLVCHIYKLKSTQIMTKKPEKGLQDSMARSLLRVYEKQRRSQPKTIENQREERRS